MNSDSLQSRLPNAFGTAYVLERELGRGGMATVFVAHDRKHGRRVAVKVLHGELAALLGADRFLREIRVTANLQHPHILGLIDSGVFGDDAEELDGRPYYVMPYIEGETLRRRLEREGQISVADAVRITCEVASALDYAHRHGVIHRDVKPENILLHDGSALVVDFGIALAVQQAGGRRMTQTGLSLGTPQYMSPEQAMGERTITARSDVYALGAVAYEMLTGEPPFTGPSVQAIVARLLAEEPRPLSAQRPSVPAHIEAAVLQALEKLPADRFASAAEFAAALANPAFSGTRAASGPLRRERTRETVRAATLLPWALLLVAAGIIALDTLRPERQPGTRGVHRVHILLPDNAGWEDELNSSVALSPDGSLLVYNGRDSSAQRRLYMRAMDRVDAIPVPGSETAHFPVFSPDGRWLGFILNRRIVKARVGGGAPEPICEVGGLTTWTWVDNDKVVFADGTGLKQCSATGQATTLIASDSTQSFNFPHALPGGRSVVFTVRRASVNRLAVLDLRTQTAKPLDIQGSDPRYVAASGHLVFAGADGVLRAVLFDAEAHSLEGEPVVVADDVRVDGQGRALVAVARSGTIVTVPAVAMRRALELVDRSGRAERPYPRLAEFADPRFSPDGRRIALTVGGDIWQLDRAQGTLTRLTFEGGAERPAWAPDGLRVAYIRRMGPRNEVRIVKGDGSAPAEPLLSSSSVGLWHVLFTPDGRSIIVRTVSGLGRRDIWRVALDSARRLVPLLQTPADEVSPTLSANGRWLAYASNESGRFEVYVRSFPDMGARHPVSLEGGTDPVWSPRGNELFYRSGPAMMVAEVRAGSTFEVLRRTRLFSSSDYAVGATYQNYDVAPDGRYFVMVRGPGGQSRLTVTLNQFENLSRVIRDGARP